MAIPALTKRIVRCWVDVNSTDSFTDVIAGGTPRAYNDASWELQVVFGYGPEKSGVLADVSLLSSLLALIWKSTSQYLSIAAAYIDRNLTLAEWNARVSARGGFEKAAHAVFVFTAAEFSFAMSGADALDLKLTLHGDTSDEPSIADAWKVSDFKVLNAGLATVGGSTQAANLIPGGAVYDGSGLYVLSGLTVSRGYRWTDGGSHDTSVTNGTETVTVSNSVFWAQGTSVTLNGTPGATVTAVVWYPATFTADELAAFVAYQISLLLGTTVGQQTFGGTAEPEGVQAAPLWSHYQQVDGSNVPGRLWVRAIGGGNINTGWV